MFTSSTPPRASTSASAALSSAPSTTSRSATSPTCATRASSTASTRASPARRSKAKALGRPDWPRPRRLRPLQAHHRRPRRRARLHALPRHRPRPRRHAEDHQHAHRFEPITGRMHHIRVHASAAGAPLIGDREHGGARTLVDARGPASMPSTASPSTPSPSSSPGENGKAFARSRPSRTSSAQSGNSSTATRPRGKPSPRPREFAQTPRRLHSNPPMTPSRPVNRAAIAALFGVFAASFAGSLVALADPGKAGSAPDPPAHATKKQWTLQYRRARRQGHRRARHRLHARSAGRVAAHPRPLRRRALRRPRAARPRPLQRPPHGRRPRRAQQEARVSQS